MMTIAKQGHWENIMDCISRWVFLPLAFRNMYAFSPERTTEENMDIKIRRTIYETKSNNLYFFSFVISSWKQDRWQLGDRVGSFLCTAPRQFTKKTTVLDAFSALIRVTIFIEKCAGFLLNKVTADSALSMEKTWEYTQVLYFHSGQYYLESWNEMPEKWVLLFERNWTRTILILFSCTTQPVQFIVTNLIFANM